MKAESDPSDSRIPQTSVEEEDLEDYKEGGYHPCHIGDTFKNNRYTIVRKLGWGYFSTVWLARDSHNNDALVALKIVRAAQNYTETAIDEIKLLKKLNETDPAHPGRQFVVCLHDQFIHVGPNGAHVCMVFEVLGENLLSLMKRYHFKGIPSKLAKQITMQVMLALDYAHRKCGIIHTDLKPENVLIRIRDVERVMREVNEMEEMHKREEELLAGYQKTHPNEVIAPSGQQDSETETATTVPVMDVDGTNGSSGSGSASDISDIVVQESEPLPASPAEAKHRHGAASSTSTSTTPTTHSSSSTGKSSISSISSDKRSMITGSQPLPSPLRRPGAKKTSSQMSSGSVPITSTDFNVKSPSPSVNTDPTDQLEQGVMNAVNSSLHSNSTHSGSTQSGSTQSGSTQSGSTQSGSTHSGNTHSDNTHSGSTQSGSTHAQNKPKADQNMADQSMPDQHTLQIPDGHIHDHNYPSIPDENMPDQTIRDETMPDQVNIEQEEQDTREADAEELEAMNSSNDNGFTALEDDRVTVKIADFGNACSTNHHFTNDIQTRQYRAPEVIVGTQWGASVDCWSLACMVFELLTGDYLFEPQNSSTYSKDEDHLAQIIELLGPLPQHLCKGKYASQYFDSRGRLRNIHKLKVWPLFDVFVGKYGFDAEEARQLCDLLLSLLRLDQESRFDCGSLLQCEWLRDTVGFEHIFVDREPQPSGKDIRGWACEIQQTDEELETELMASQQELNRMWQEGDAPPVETPDPAVVAAEAADAQL